MVKLSAASVASPAPVERGGKDLSDSSEEEGGEKEEEEEEEEGGEEVLQYGSDETGIHRQGTYNQWCMIKHNDGSTEVVTMEAGGILVGTTAEEVASHVESTWERGQTALEALQSELGADKLVPMVNGGLNLSKLRSLMHDTVNASHPPPPLSVSIFFYLSPKISPLSPSLTTAMQHGERDGAQDFRAGREEGRGVLRCRGVGGDVGRAAVHAGLPVWQPHAPALCLAVTT